MLSISSNISSLTAQERLNSSQAALATSLSRLSSGLRINTAADDAAGLKISRALREQIKNLDDTPRTVNDGINLTQTVDSALSQVTDALQRTRELATQQQGMQPGDEGYQGISDEMAKLAKHINDIAQSTNFNGQNLLDGSFQGTHNTVNGVDVSFGAIGDVAALVGTKNSTLHNVDDIDKAIQAVGDIRSNVGSTHTRLSQVNLSLSVSSAQTPTNTRVMDADAGSSTASMTKAQMLQSAGSAMLAQANALPQQVLALLR